MRQSILAILFWSAVLTLGGCDDGGRDHGHHGKGRDYVSCQQFVSCGQCTPVVGCGWCSYGQGQGVCLDEPNDCMMKQFTWTWESTGCATDAGAAASDAAMSGPDAVAPTDSGEVDVETEGGGQDSATE